MYQFTYIYIYFGSVTNYCGTRYSKVTKSNCHAVVFFSFFSFLLVVFTVAAVALSNNIDYRVPKWAILGIANNFDQ